MSFPGNSYVAIIRDKESVVVRSIEKKLNEMELPSTFCSFDVKELELHRRNVSLFLVYMPADVNKEIIKTLLYLSDVITESNAFIMIIGEKKQYIDIAAAIPDVRKWIWIDRPLEMDVLTSEIDEIQSALKDRSKKKKILIVDDDPTYAKTVRLWLKELYDVSLVTAGMQAISFLNKKSVDLVLLDYEMPVVDGPQILGMLKSDPNMADIPVIFLTGISSKESVERVVALKPSGYILKSTPKNELVAYLKDFFAKKDSR